MLSDYERTQELVASATNASGAADEQYGKTLDSLETKLNKLKNAWDQFTMGIANSTAIKVCVDLLTSLIGLLNNLTEHLGSAGGAFAKLGLSLAGLKTGKVLFSSLLASITKMGGEGTSMGKMFATTFREGMTSEWPKTTAAFSGLFGNMVKDVKSHFVSKLVTEDLTNKINDIVKTSKLDSLGDLMGYSMDGFAAEQLIQDLGEVGKSLHLTTDQVGALSIMINNGVDATTAIQAALKGYNAEQIKAALAIGKETLAEQANTYAKKGSLTILYEKTTATVGAKVALIADTIATIANTAATNANTTANKKNIISQIAEKVTTMSAAKQTLIAAVAIVALCLAIKGLIALYKYLKTLTPEGQFEAASEAADNAAAAVNELTSSYENLQTSLDELSEQQKTLESLTEGTQEWKQAVIETNNQILELIDKYPELAKFVESDNGVLSIDVDDEGFQQVLTDYSNAIVKAQAASAGAQFNLIEKQNDLAYSELDYNTKVGNALKGNPTTGLKNQEDTNEVARLIAEGQILTTEALRDYIKENKLVMAVNEENFKALKEYGQSLITNEANRDVQYQSMINAALDSSGLEGEEKTKAENFATEDMMEKLQMQAEDNLEGSAAELADRYAQEVLNLSAGEYTVDDGKITYENADGEEKTVSKEAIKSSLAAADATEEMANRMEAFSKKVSNFGDDVSDAAENLFKSEEGGSLTKANVNNLQGKTDEELKAYLQSPEGGGWTDAEVKATYGSWEDFIANVQSSIEIAANSFSDAKARLATMGTDISNTWKESDLTNDGLNAVVDGLSQIQKVSGNDAMAKASEKMAELNEQLLGAGLNSGQISEILSFVDWTDLDSIDSLSESLKDKFEDLELNFEDVEDEINTFEDDIASLAKATKKVDLTTLKEDVTSLSKILSNLRSEEQNRSFSEEDYTTLTTIGGLETDNFTYNLETDTYDYIGENTNEIVLAIEQQTADLLAGADLDREIASGEAVKSLIDEGYEVDDTSIDSISQFLYKYLVTAGEDAIVSRDAINAAVSTKDLDKLNEYLDSILEDYYNLTANKETKEDYEKIAQSIEAQTMSPNGISAMIRDSENVEGADAYTDALLAQAQAAGVAEGFISQYAAALKDPSLTKENLNTYSEDLADITSIFQQANSWGLDTTLLTNYATALQEANKELSNQQAYAKALNDMNLNAGYSELVNNYEDWCGILWDSNDATKVVNKNTVEYQQTLSQLKKTVSQMLNTSVELSDEFFNNADNMALLEQAALGDVDAIDKLRDSAAQDVFKTNMIEVGLSSTDETYNDFYNLLDDLNSAIDAHDFTLDPTLDTDDFNNASDNIIAKMNSVIAAAGWTKDQVQAYFGALGYDVNLTTAEYTVPGQTHTTKHSLKFGEMTIGEIQDTWTEDPYTTEVPVIETISSNGKSGGNINSSSISAGKNNTKGGKSSGGSSKETEWENPYDKQYNTLEDINAELKKRERLEKRYQILCARGKDTQAMTRNYYKDLVASLEKEYDYQDKIATAKKKEIKSYLKQNKSLQKYATFNFDDLTVEIDWKAIQKVDKANNEELGEKIEALVSKLEEYRDAMEDAKDAQYDILQTLEDTKQELIDAYLDFEERVASALQQIDQDMVDEQEKLYDAMNDAASNLVDSIRENIDATRQLRDNEDTEEEIAKKERRLAYLRLDTSGANALEIKQLEEELEDEKLSYQDSLVDQALDKLQDQNDKAAEQRSRQIELMNSQIEWNEKNAVYTQSVRDLLDKAMKSDGKLDIEDELYKVLYKGENWNSYSAEKQAEMLKTANQEAINARQGAQVIDGTHVTTDSKLNYETPTRSGNIVTTSSDTGSGTKAATKTTNTSKTTSSSKKTVTTTIKKGVAAAIVYGANYGGWGTGDTRKSRLNAKFTNGWSTIQGYIDSEAKNNNSNLIAFKKSHTISDYYYKKYKTGGLADYTGPAWLDGTKSRPEMVLNSTDTQNFIQLKDILRDAVNGGLGSQSTSGDYTFDIDINVEELANDYDVSQLAAQVRQELVSAMTYRNVNTIGIMR